MTTLNIIYREKDIPNIREYDVYIANGGYDALKKAIGMKPCLLYTSDAAETERV